MTAPEWDSVEMPSGSGTPWVAIIAGAVFAVVVLVVYGRSVPVSNPGGPRA